MNNQTQNTNNQTPNITNYGANPVLAQAGVRFPAKHMRVHFREHVEAQLRAIGGIDREALSAEDLRVVEAAEAAWKKAKLVEDKIAQSPEKARRQEKQVSGFRAAYGDGGQDSRPAPAPIPQAVTDLFAAFQLAYPNPSNRHEKTAILASAAVAEQSNLSDGERAALARLRAAWDAPVRWCDLGLPIVDLRDLVERGVVRRPVMADVTSVEDAQTALDAVIETRENSARADWNVSAWAEGTPDPVFILAPYDFASLAQMEVAWRSIVARVKIDYARPVKTGGGWSGSRK